MRQTLRKLWDVLREGLPRPALLWSLGGLQAFRLLLGWAHPSPDGTLASRLVVATPWYAWALGWPVLLWVCSLRYSLERKRAFDRASLNFFRAFLDVLIREGHQLFHLSGEKDFYSRVDDWRRMVVQGMAIGLGHRRSLEYFEKRDGAHPLSGAYRESLASGSNEPLCRALQGDLEELETVRMELGVDKGEPAAPKRAEMAAPPDPPRLPPK